MAKLRGEDFTEMIKEEAVRRAEIYHTFAPGTEQCEVKPLTFKRFIPAIVGCVILIGLFMWATWGIFPAYYP